MTLSIATRAATATLRRQASRTTVRALSSGENSTLTPDKTHNVFTRKKSEYQLGKHRSNALSLLQTQPIIEVEGNVAVCDGGGGALGHPLEYIKLGKRADYPPGRKEEDGYPCIYCGLRYRSTGGGGGH